ncbi:unnamed protein product [Tilletia controversa]|uniref:Uncharacterized protein n=3 Tax=Tilletia TaxID=13289 RepID=A0A8X7MYL2_9BASI|nr:hypothetical protein CF336_g1093 [Tilletia laevis]KAE8205510.1 hypothetical protein CF328_g463 [Tilletia controversa]KAE8265427.1 hypothetical protein A4X03_0g272 [Tilletia caries]KAE8208164.1 hypothetical protein CF335_g615 [Tilletia laevis]KAE8253568.1 hypothetical protein A4X06_0g1348 [Tilletia controversa]
MKFALASALALVGAASAATNGPYAIGASAAGSEKGVLNTTLTCNVQSTGLNLKNQKILLGVAANIPNRVHSNQPFYLYASTRLIVPASINNLAYGFGARTYGGKATSVTVKASGSSPSSVDAAGSAGLTIQNASVVQNGPSVLYAPGQGKSLKVGTFKRSSAGPIVFSFGDIEATVNTYDANGKPTIITAKVSCPAQDKPVSLAFVSVGGSGSTTTLTPSSSVKIPTVPADTTAGTIGLDYSCTFTGYGKAPVRIYVGGVKEADGFSITKGQGNIYISSQVVTLAKGKNPSASKFKLKVNTLNFEATNASPSTKNGIPSGGISSGILPLSTSSVVTLPSGAPSTTLPAISFSPSGSSTSLISIGSAAGTVTIYDSSSKVLDTVSFSCPALSPAVPVLPFDH